MSNTAFLILPYIDAGQNQKEVTHNQALDLLDARAKGTQFGLSAVLRSGAETLAAALSANAFIVPFNPDGSSMTLVLKQVFARQETTGLSQTDLQVQKYSGTGTFSGTNMLATTLAIAISAFESSTSTMAGSGANTVVSGDKIRVNVTAAGTGAAGLNVLGVFEKTT